MPLTQLSPDGRTYLVLFEPAAPVASKGAVLPSAKPGGRKVREIGARAPGKAESLRNLRLEEELAATREYLQAMIDQQESSDEELQSANEEIQSSNEELQSINDDLGASREELQANNEELQTLNEELHTRIRREEEAREYADAIIETMSPLLVLDQDLRVNIVNSAFCEHFQVTPQETANRLIYDLGNGQWNIPELRTLLEDILPRSSEFKEYEVSHTFESLGPRTMLLSGRRVDHIQKIFLSIHDISIRKEAQEQLRLSEERFGAIIRQAAVGIAETDLTGHFLLVNRRFCETVGYTEKQLLKMKMQDITHPDDLPHNLALFEEAAREGTGFVIEKRYVRPDGSCAQVRNEVTRLTDGQGRTHFMLAISHDITKLEAAERELRENAERLRFMADFMPQKIFTARPDGEVDYLNRQWMEFAGPALEPSKVGNLWQVIHPDDHTESVHRWRHSVGTDEPFQMEHRLQRADGQYRWHLSRAVPMRDADGRVMMWIGSCTDIDDQRQVVEAMREAREKLSNQTAELERLVAERTTELKASNSEMEAFVYSIAHDLRAPLRSMQGFSQVLVEQHGGALGEEGREYARVISESALFMDSLLVDLLGFAQVAQEKIDLVPVNLGEAVRTVLQRCEAEVREKQAGIEVITPLPTVLAQRAVLGQILTNLLSNALKFVAAGVRPQIRIWAEERTEAVRLWVEDNGIGLPEENRGRIFQVFQRLHTEGYAGTGIGLAIVQKGMERMKGRVGVESALGQGSRFWIELSRPHDPAANTSPPR